MARAQITVTVGTALLNGDYLLSGAGGADPVADNAAVLTAINAMGALTGYGALTGAAAALAAAQAAQAVVTADLSANVVISVDTAVITTKNQLRAALRQALKMAESGVAGLT